ncbi:MAG: hypothetical protein HY240_11545 [Actinobacteria bacterium]|nr:hypothetical protein [Actinomycetota bacterium]
MRSLATIGWIVIFAAVFVWQGIGLSRGADWPTMSDMLRAFMAPAAGRICLFAMWLWLGWHLFVRHWELFLRSPR